MNGLEPTSLMDATSKQGANVGTHGGHGGDFMEEHPLDGAGSRHL